MRSPRPPKPEGVEPNPRTKKAKPDAEPFDLTGWLNAATGGGSAASFTDASLDDASVVVIAASRFDRYLLYFIVMHAGQVPTRKQLDVIFKYPGPLSSFSSKIDLCYLMGHLSTDMKADLDIVRSIRNDFCHSVTKRSFADPDIVEKCKRLSGLGLSPEQMAELETLMEKTTAPARTRFIMAGMGLMIHIMGFLYKRLAEITLVEANKEDIAKTAQTRLESFGARLTGRVSAILEQASQHHPEGSTAPEKSSEGPTPPPQESLA